MAPGDRCPDRGGDAYSKYLYGELTGYLAGYIAGDFVREFARAFVRDFPGGFAGGLSYCHGFYNRLADWSGRWCGVCDNRNDVGVIHESDPVAGGVSFGRCWRRRIHVVEEEGTPHGNPLSSLCVCDVWRDIIMSKIYVKGSFTVEAAFVMIPILLIVMSLLYLTFYAHDKAAIASLGPLMLRKESQIEVKKELEKKLWLRDISSVEMKKNLSYKKMKIQTKKTLSIGLVEMLLGEGETYEFSRWDVAPGEYLWNYEIMKEG